MKLMNVLWRNLERLKFVFAITFLFSQIAYSQPGLIHKVFYDSTGVFEVNAIEHLYDGNFILAGCSNSFAMVMKVDTAAKIFWTKIMGHNSGGWYGSYIHAVTQTHDSCFILAGEWLGNSMLVKMRPNGDTVFCKQIDFQTHSSAYDVTETFDHGFAIAGMHSIIKIDSSGNLEWSKMLNTLPDDILFSIEQTSDGGFIIASRYGIIKTDASGHVTWARKLSTDLGIDIIEKNNALYLLSFGSISSRFTAFLTKMDVSGNVIWNHAYITDGWQAPYYPYTSQAKIRQMPDGGFYFVTRHGAPFDLAPQNLIRTDSLGILVSSKQLYLIIVDAIHTDYNLDFIFGNGPFIGNKLIDEPYSQVGFVRTDSADHSSWGNCEFSAPVKDTLLPIPFTYISVTAIDSGVLTAFSPILSEVVLSVYNGCIGQTNGVEPVKSADENLSLAITPNPGNGKFLFSLYNSGGLPYQLEVYNISGEKVWNISTTFEVAVTADLDFLPDGVYLVRAYCHEKVLTNKLIKLK